MCAVASGCVALTIARDLLYLCAENKIATTTIAVPLNGQALSQVVVVVVVTIC